MQVKRYSIWSGSAGIVWALAFVCLILAECVLFYTKISRSSSGWFSMSIVLLPIMISLPLSTGINVYRKLTRLPAIVDDHIMVNTCSLYVACVVVVANAALFMCIADGLLRPYHSGPK
jgi:hypothetical protein